MTRVITITNRKGGCGKTTTAVNLGSALAQLGYTVTLVDTDPQCNLTMSFVPDLSELDKAKALRVTDAYIQKTPAIKLELDFGEQRLHGRLFLVPGSNGMSSVRHVLDVEIEQQRASQQITELDARAIQNEHWHRLAKSLASLKGKRDFIIIDTPPDLGFTLTSALIAADYSLIPITASGYDLAGLGMMRKAIEQVQKSFRPELQLLGVLICKAKRSSKLGVQTRGVLAREVGPEYVLDTEIGDSVRLREATLVSQTIHEYSPKEQSAQEYTELAKEIVKRLKKAEAVGGSGALTEAKPEAVGVANG